ISVICCNNPQGPDPSFNCVSIMRSNSSLNIFDNSSILTASISAGLILLFSSSVRPSITPFV
ncbi:GSCOCG00000575001-RA-CDS, partial [Cotesia congregata]